ncbi:MAG: hypothetical protein GF398_04315 [Chitinivibrionales bacterium]|nr:hypothetical protein [Chitinivibrionales bacterium]
MNNEHLKIRRKIMMSKPTLLMAFSGWMDGGDVSTGTINYLVDKYEAFKCANIEPEPFYLYNFPGSMEISSLFRPEIRIRDGIIHNFEPPESSFFCAQEQNMLLFTGKEPNLNWTDYCDTIIAFCKDNDVQNIYFIGSVAGLTPHTREPRFSFATNSTTKKQELIKLGIRPINYEGPGSIVTMLSSKIVCEKVDMVTIVAEIPSYVQGYNPRCVEAAIRCIARLTDKRLDISELRSVSEEFDKKVKELVLNQPELSEKVKELEEEYARQEFDAQIDDLTNML